MSETPVFTDLRRTFEWTCPECGSDHYDVGEVDGQILTCEGCSKVVLVRWTGLSAGGAAAISVGSGEPYQHIAEEPEVTWQWCYVEKWADGSGVYERVTFDSESKACQYLADAADNVRGFNLEVTEADRIVASVEIRRTWEPGEWEPVRSEGCVGA